MYVLPIKQLVAFFKGCSKLPQKYKMETEIYHAVAQMFRTDTGKLGVSVSLAHCWRVEAVFESNEKVGYFHWPCCMFTWLSDAIDALSAFKKEECSLRENGIYNSSGVRLFRPPKPGDLNLFEFPKADKNSHCSVMLWDPCVHPALATTMSDDTTREIFCGVYYGIRGAASINGHYMLKVGETTEKEDLDIFIPRDIYPALPAFFPEKDALDFIRQEHKDNGKTTYTCCLCDGRCKVLFSTSVGNCDMDIAKIYEHYDWNSLYQVSARDLEKALKTEIKLQKAQIKAEKAKRSKEELKKYKPPVISVDMYFDEAKEELRIVKMLDTPMYCELLKANAGSAKRIRVSAEYLLNAFANQKAVDLKEGILEIAISKDDNPIFVRTYSTDMYGKREGEAILIAAVMPMYS